MKSLSRTPFQTMTPRFLTFLALTACLAVPLGNASLAHADDDNMRGIAESLGLAVPAATPPPFVTELRPTGDLPWIPVFTPPPEPKIAKLTPQQLRAQQGELDGANKAHDAIRNAFPPSAKALAEQRARQARDAAKKKGQLPMAAATPAVQ